MKNPQKGYALPILVAIIAILVIISILFFYRSTKTEAPVIVNVNTTNNTDLNLLTYSGTTDTGINFTLQYPSTWVSYKYSCNIDGVAFWPKSSAPNFSQGGVCGMESFLDSAPIEIQTMAQPVPYLRDKNYTDIYKQMSASLVKVDSQALLFLKQMQIAIGTSLEMTPSVGYKNIHGYKVSLPADAFLKAENYVTSKFGAPNNTYTTERGYGYENSHLLCMTVGLGSGSSQTDLPYVWCANKDGLQ